DVVVLGLPRGGVPVAFEVASALGVPMDVIVVRKIGVPRQPELAMGAAGEDGVVVLNDDVLRRAGVGPAGVDAATRQAQHEVEQRAAEFRRVKARVPLEGTTALVVDDGIATGSTARAACRIARAHGAARVVLAVPVAPPQSTADLADAADEITVLEAPDPFFAVGQFYVDFSPTTDEEVVALLRRSTASPASDDHRPPLDRDVAVARGALRLRGHLSTPADAVGLVIFAHGSGSSRHSPRNRDVAAALHASGFGTLLFDLLTAEEELDRDRVFDIELLAQRLGAVTDWASAQRGVENLPIGYFGASTGAGAALWAAAEAPTTSPLFAIVSRGGRPDLARAKLGEVRAPTLLIVGGRDDHVLELNRQARAEMRCPTELSVVPAATHLFEEPGALAEVARLATAWFTRWVTRPADSPPSQPKPAAGGD
ncbi:MAG TPA: phosphoribosyltransferase family protein, partial [Acidimicrobiales bacterium]|nr:phosphoribosyltransferase family protein [Acidimicrobiales bacterium]